MSLELLLYKVSLAHEMFTAVEFTLVTWSASANTKHQQLHTLPKFLLCGSVDKYMQQLVVVVVVVVVVEYLYSASRSASNALIVP